MENDNYVYGMRPVLEAIKTGKKFERIYLKKGLDGESFHEMMTIIDKDGIPFQFVPYEKLDSLVGRVSHQGVVAVVSKIEYADFESTVDAVVANAAKDPSFHPLFVLLDGVSDVRNFGAIARSCECAGANAIILPAKGGAPVNADSLKTSAGALLRIPVSKVSNLKVAMYYLLQMGFQVIACTEHCDKNIYDIDFKKPTAIVMGSEGRGISSSVLSICTDRAAIPMKGTIGSLNVSNAASIVLFEVVRQRMIK
ncbi:MAG: 23S rRNA (guanosine(2251)-2'-O)-methyltransferase RlmB [Bacteroidales bacterium]|jgi:23S rRNA (guanosine2251-2'-O)-methyltransferase|nr:23S rRNA (guanosine(2251)-2'-O)-methyltransferase RlmB [Bacteroidales bacterium]MCI2122065.1 23S rRNA (guanosine(2251)-2'-O)-methyltransferase RlmB [Bacteroidales bacterium]MCI2146194.1 23S rRNA (guanosine(2251)-2'-O)-methyltransferase RlmB [Bacteroidales bacterium]